MIGPGQAQRDLQLMAGAHQPALAEGRVGAFICLEVDTVERDVQMDMVGVDVQRRQPLMVGHAESGTQGGLDMAKLVVAGPLALGEGHHQMQGLVERAGVAGLGVADLQQGQADIVGAAIGHMRPRHLLATMGVVGDVERHPHRPAFHNAGMRAIGAAPHRGVQIGQAQETLVGGAGIPFRRHAADIGAPADIHPERAGHLGAGFHVAVHDPLSFPVAAGQAASRCFPGPRERWGERGARTGAPGRVARRRSSWALPKRTALPGGEAVLAGESGGTPAFPARPERFRKFSRKNSEQYDAHGKEHPPVRAKIYR